MHDYFESLVSADPFSFDRGSGLGDRILSLSSMAGVILMGGMLLPLRKSAGAGADIHDSACGFSV